MGSKSALIGWRATPFPLRSEPPALFTQSTAVPFKHGVSPHMPPNLHTCYNSCKVAKNCTVNSIRAIGSAEVKFTLLKDLDATNPMIVFFNFYLKSAKTYTKSLVFDNLRIKRKLRLTSCLQESTFDDISDDEKSSKN